jgi:tRNA(Ile2) C34 agmatinyltransferase TiaS
LEILLAILLALVMRVVWKRVNPQCPMCGARTWHKTPDMNWRCNFCRVWYEPTTGRHFF